MAGSPITDKDTELTMCDVLQEEQELEEDANAVLGGSDDTNCSYDQGYVSRQALYACMTCANSEAGVCLACCYACHDGHEIVELYTKRNFRCDCGNSKFNEQSSCKLRPNKQPVNCKNKYNHNFKGLYCTCSRPYPDPDDHVADEMIQCVFCEDWYHGRHLQVSVPDDYFEMICSKCMAAHKFLYSYLNSYRIDVDDSGVNTRKSISKVKPEESVTPIAAETCNSSGDATPSMPTEDESTDTPKDASSKNPDCYVKVEAKEAINGICTEDKAIAPVKLECSNANSDSVGTPTVVNSCMLKSINADVDIDKGSGFWPENWRKDLCRCSNCMNMYSEMHCEFLLNPDDTIQAYEERGKGGSAESQYDKGLSALGQLDRVKQMEAVRAYTNMKGELKEYLKEFADNKKTVCESDIKEFFERMAKKQKLNNGVPHFCR